MILERGERADAAPRSPPRSPRRGPAGEEWHPAPAPRQETAEDDERGEGEVEDDQRVREEPYSIARDGRAPQAATRPASTRAMRSSAFSSVFMLQAKDSRM